jgi:hypothetical protein
VSSRFDLVIFDGVEGARVDNEAIDSEVISESTKQLRAHNLTGCRNGAALPILALESGAQE